MSEWPRVRLGDVVNLLTGFPFKSAQYTEDPSGPRLLRGDNIVQGTLRWDGVKRWPTDRLYDVDGYWLKQGDVVLAMDRPWIEAGLKYASLHDSDLPALLVQRVSRLRGTEALNTRFLRYVIGSRAFTEHVLAVQTGTAVPHISGAQIKSFEFLLPTFAEQDAIADVLGALDDKIELNQRMNETLVVMARALFKDWFVDFGPTYAKVEGRPPYLAPELWEVFPDTFDEEGKPAGWERALVSDVACHEKGTITPSNFPDEIFDHHSIPAYDAGQMPARDSGAAILSNKTEVPEDAVLLSKLNPEIPRVWLTAKPGRERQICSTEFLVFCAKEGFGRAWLYLLFTERGFRERLQGMVTGTSKSHQRVSPKSVLGAEIVVAELGSAVLRSFSGTVDPMLERVLLNRKESRTLAETRDLLLPKLMSGEIQLRDAEKVVESVA